MNDRRDAFLVEIYKQMFNDIDRHILVVWQCVGVLIGALAVFALVEKSVLSFDFAAAIIVLLCAWLCAHLLDAAYWYNRNLAIIANIERQFLTKDDLRQIHYYFGVHRPKNKMLTHLKIQMVLGTGLAGLVLVVHFFDSVWPGFSLPLSCFDPLVCLPYLLAGGAAYYYRHVRDDRNQAYLEFIENSPGIDVETSGVSYGPGHGHDSVESK